VQINENIGQNNLYMTLIDDYKAHCNCYRRVWNDYIRGRNAFMDACSTCGDVGVT